MSEYSCFDIIGPVMVGPSSSHTAGAVRLGRFAPGNCRGNAAAGRNSAAWFFCQNL